MSKFKEIIREEKKKKLQQQLVQSRFLDWVFDFFENRQWRGGAEFYIPNPLPAGSLFETHHTHHTARDY